jgi:hypothetical protein
MGSNKQFFTVSFFHEQQGRAKGGSIGPGEKRMGDL